ncbi:MAG: hypothetical protein P8186_28660 [Anaerolineae bacterium]|jgi:hypothetical protein
MIISKPLRIILQVSALASLLMAGLSYLHDHSFSTVSYALLAIFLWALSRQGTAR